MWWCSQHTGRHPVTGKNRPFLELGGKGSFAQPFTGYQASAASALTLYGPRQLSSPLVLKGDTQNMKITAEGLWPLRNALACASKCLFGFFFVFFLNDVTSWPIMDYLRIEASSTIFCDRDIYLVRDLPCIWWGFMLSAVDGGLYISDKIHQLDCHTLQKREWLAKPCLCAVTDVWINQCQLIPFAIRLALGLSRCASRDQISVNHFDLKTS